MEQAQQGQQGQQGPLAGVKVLDMTSVVMGPFATQILAGLGAEAVSYTHLTLPTIYSV